MNATGRGYRAASEHFGVPESDLRELCRGPASPPLARAREESPGPQSEPAPPLELHDGGARWLRVADVALHFGVSPQAVRNWCTQDKVIWRRAGTSYEVLLSSAEEYRAGGDERPPIVVPEQGPVADSTGLPDVGWQEMHLRRLEALAAPWLRPGGELPRGGDKVLVEIRHTRAALELARKAVPVKVDDLPLDELLARVRARLPDVPEAVLTAMAAELARRWRAVLTLSREDGRATLGEDETWQHDGVVQ
jgi:hypothetical protein